MNGIIGVKGGCRTSSVLSKFQSPVATGNFVFIWGGLASRRLEELRRLASRRNFWAVATLVPPK